MNPFMKELHSKFRKAMGGNVSMIFACAAPFLMLGIAVAIDFTNASVARTKLNDDADAAALAALTPAMMQETDAEAQAAATAMFNARAAALTSLVPGQTTVTVTITHPNGATSRQVVVSYTAENNTIFSGVLHQTYLSIAGTSTSEAALPPNIDFYLLLDNSPSMSLPATSTGITQMVGLTPDQGGCAFACHQSSTNNGDTQGNLCSVATSPVTYASPSSSTGYCPANDGHGHAETQIDNYAMARYNSITLRLDELTSGVATLMQTAYNNSTSGLYATPPDYRFAAYSMDSLWQIGTTNTELMALTSSYQSGWTTDSANFGVMEMYSNNNVCGNSACSSSGGTGDVATSFSHALGSINTTMPAPGNGTNVSGDTPQEVVFFVTDGVEDDTATSCSQPMTGSRCQAPIDPTLCTTIKNRGIKIAILYTQYLQVPSNSWYSSWIAPFQPDIGTYLQQCASPNLYYEAAIGDNLGQDLSTLFNIVQQEAALSN